MTALDADVPVVEVEYRHPGQQVAGLAGVQPHLSRDAFRASSNVSLTEGDSVIIRYCALLLLSVLCWRRCKPEANPPAAVAWRRAGRAGVWSQEQEVLLEEVGREDGGIYTCTAHNTLGVSGPREIVLDVECESDSPIVALFVAYKVRHFTNLNGTDRAALL